VTAAAPPFQLVEDDASPWSVRHQFDPLLAAEGFMDGVEGHNFRCTDDSYSRGWLSGFSATTHAGGEAPSGAGKHQEDCTSGTTKAVLFSHPSRIEGATGRRRAL
jgi:hypothetical protein